MVQLADQSGVSVLHSRRDRREPFLPGGKERAEGEGQGKGKARVSTWKRRRWLAWLTRRRGGRRRMAVTLFAEFQPHPSPHEEKKTQNITLARALALYFILRREQSDLLLYLPPVAFLAYPDIFFFWVWIWGLSLGLRDLCLCLRLSLVLAASGKQQKHAQYVLYGTRLTMHHPGFFVRFAFSFCCLKGEERERESVPPLLARCFACPP